MPQRTGALQKLAQLRGAPEFASRPGLRQPSAAFQVASDRSRPLPILVRAPCPKRQRTGAVQDLADIRAVLVNSGGHRRLNGTIIVRTVLPWAASHSRSALRCNQIFSA